MILNQFILFARFFLYICYPMIIQNKRIIASILFVLISVVCVAQSPPPPGTPPPGLVLPIDGGVLFGLFCGLFYGAVKLLKRDKAN